MTPFQIELALKNAARIHDDRSDGSFPPSGLDFPRLDCLDALTQVLGGTGLCPATPRGGCRHEIGERAGKLYVTNSDDSSRDAMSWFWYKGAATSIGDYGDPLGSTSFSLCMYRPAAPRLMMNLFAPAGGQCASTPCWKRSPFGAGKFTYKDKLLSPSGLKDITFLPGADGKTKIKITGKGVNLRMPPGPFSTPVVMQLINHANSVCWEATYTSPTRNDRIGFRSFSD